VINLISDFDAPLPLSEIKMPDALQDFVNFCSILQGDEKSESQIFLDRFFQAFYLDILPPINRGIPKTHDLGFCFLLLPEFRNCPLEAFLSGLTSAPQTDTASPAAKIFLAALISRS